MTNIPRIAARFADPDGSKRRARGEELLDMLRQHTYSSVIRRAKLNDHLTSCRKCKPERTCVEARELAGRVAAALNAIGDCREQLAALDAERDRAEAQERSPVAVSGTLRMF